jgi:hypothetical protein
MRRYGIKIECYNIHVLLEQVGVVVAESATIQMLTNNFRLVSDDTELEMEMEMEMEMGCGATRGPMIAG